METDKKPRRFLYRFLDYREKIAKGNSWIAIIEEYIPIQKGIDLVFTYLTVKVAISGTSIWQIALYIVYYGAYKVLWELLRFGIATVYWKKNVWKAELDWARKNEKYQGPILEERRTLRSIAENTPGATNYIKDLEHE